ncbi:uncharacterized protein BCN122_III0469 [Burkholderia cenocepacia]|nr:uncharacterized protein BCN122_III0469 [Burkholderia cenocepacia]
MSGSGAASGITAGRAAHRAAPSLPRERRNPPATGGIMQNAPHLKSEWRSVTPWASISI